MKKTLVPLAVLLIIGFASAQTTTIRLIRMPFVAWQAPTLNEDGSPLEDLAGFMLAVVADGEDPNQGAIPLAERIIDDPAARIIQDPTLSTQLAAQRFSAWVAAYDFAGNVGPYGGPALLDLTTVGPGATSAVVAGVGIFQAISRP